MPSKRLKVSGMELDFAAISFKQIGEQVARSQECEARGYHVGGQPSQARVQRVGADDLAIDLCQDCGIWTLAERFR